MATIRAHFDGKVFVPDEPVDLPAGTPGEFHLSDATPRSNQPSDPSEFPLLDLARKLAEFPDDSDAPTDGAAQHDHYLYGHPKR